MADSIARHNRPAILRLVPFIKPVPCQDTINATVQLARLARMGDLKGLVFAGFYTSGKVFNDAAGSAFKDPLCTLGAVRVLTSDIETLARGHMPDGWES